MIDKDKFIEVLTRSHLEWEGGYEYPWAMVGEFLIVSDGDCIQAFSASGLADAIEAANEYVQEAMDTDGEEVDAFEAVNETYQDFLHKQD